MSKSLHTLQVENMELSMELGEMQDELLRMQGVIWKCQELFEMIRENNGNAPHVFNCAESGLSVIERKGIRDMDKQNYELLQNQECIRLLERLNKQIEINKDLRDRQQVHKRRIYELEALYKKAKDELVGKSHTEYEQELKPCTLEENAILMGHDPKFDLPKIHETVYAYFCENGVLKRDLLFYNVLGRWSNWETGELLKVKVIRWWSLPKLNVDPRICSSGFGVEK